MSRLPTVCALPSEGTRFLAGTTFDLAAPSVSAEYEMSGQARSYAHVNGNVEVVDGAEFATRMIFYRPADDRAFNSSV